jgi:hypothetical protein
LGFPLACEALRIGGSDEGLSRAIKVFEPAPI